MHVLCELSLWDCGPGFRLRPDINLTARIVNKSAVSSDIIEMRCFKLLASGLSLDSFNFTLVDSGY